MANLLSFLVLFATGAVIMVTEGRPVTTGYLTDAAKIDALCTMGGLECAAAQNILPSNGVHRDTAIHTVNDLQRDFYLESALVAGAQMTLDDHLRDPTPKQAFLTSTAAQKLPALTSSNSLQLLQYFGVVPNTEMATAIATAAYLCGYGALPGEHMQCAASANTMAAFVASELGLYVKILSTSDTPSSTPMKKAPVTIVDVSKGSVDEGKEIVVCHILNFPSALYYCHRVTGTKVITATLKPAATDDLIKAVGICHIDTSMWLSTHPAFKALHIPRGDEACHWLIDSDLVFVSTMSSTTNIPQ